MSDLLNIAAQRWWQWMARMSIQVCYVAAIVWLLDVVLKRWAWPQLRAALWLAVLIKLVLPPTLHLPISISRIAMPSGLLTPIADLPPAPTSLPPVAFAVWSIGLLIALIGMTWRCRRLRAIWLGSLQRRVPGWFNRMVRESADTLGMKRIPRVVVARDARGPAVVGFVRPAVVIPSRLLASGDTTQLEHVLLHELAHVHRRDPMRHLVCWVLRLVYWFHPIVWLAHARMSTLREIRCDETVTRCLRGEVVDYRRTLLELARVLLDRPTASPVAFVGRQSQLMARLDWLNRPMAPRSPIRGAATALACMLVVVAGAAMGPAAPKPSADCFPDPQGLTEGCLRLHYTVIGMLAKQAGESNTSNHD